MDQDRITLRSSGPAFGGPFSFTLGVRGSIAEKNGPDPPLDHNL